MPPQELYETGAEPDYTVDQIARVEHLSDGSVRIYVAAEWRGGLRIEYSARVCSAERLAEFGRALLMIAADVRNQGEERRPH